MIKSILLALALLPGIALGASDYRTEPEEMLFEKGVAYTRRDESSGATVNALATNTTYVKLASTVSTINGMAAPAAGVPKFVMISNMTGGPVIFGHQAAAASAANRFDLPEAEDLEVADRSSASFIYDHGASRWVVAGGGGGGGAADAVDLTYTPSVGTDWPDPDPATGQEALDDLGERVTDNTADIATKLTTPSGAQNGLGIEQSGGSPAWKSQAPRKNWLVNESFEYGTATTSWTVSGTWTTDTTAENVIAGSQSLKMPSGAASISQSITPPASLVGQSIQQTVWVKTTDSAVQVCSLRAGSSFECKNAPADGLWHNIGFTYTDPGTGTRGISVSRASGTADTYVDFAYVGPYEPNVPANITLGGDVMGYAEWAVNGSCTGWTVGSTSFTTVNTDADCVPTAYGLVSPPSTGVYGVAFTAEAGYYYELQTSADISGQAQYNGATRFSDGTEFSNEVMLKDLGNSGSSIASGTFWYSPTTAGAKNLVFQMKATSGAATHRVNGDYVKPRITVIRHQTTSKLKGTIITDEPWYYISSKLTTRVTTTPSKEGEYRSYAKNGSAYTYADAAPSIAPSGTNGMNIQGRAYSSGGGSDGNTRYEIFIGRDKTFIIEAYSSTGRTGQLDHKHFFASTSSEIGLSNSYDPSTGVLTVDAGATDSSVSNRYIGNILTPGGAALTQPGSGYFDVKVFSNPLAAGMKTAENYLQLDGHDGVDTTNSRILRFTSTYVNKGSAFTTATTTAAGTSVTINEDGFYSISFSDRNPASVDSFAITKNATSVTADASNFTSAMGLLAAARSTTDWAVNLAWSGPLKKGDVIRVHTNGNSTSNAIVNSMFAIAKVPSPFEVVGGAGSSGPKVEYVSFGGATEPNACTGTPCTAWRKSSGVSDVTRSTTGTYSVNFVSGTFAEAPTCTFTSYAVNNYARNQISTTVSTTSWPILTRDTNSQSNIDSSGYVICVGR